MLFKIFRSIPGGPGVDEIANAWLRSNPGARVMEWEYGSFDDGVEFIFIMYRMARKRGSLNIRGLDWN